MKKSILILSVVLISLPAVSQSRKYKKAMHKAIEMMNEATDRETSMQSVETFEAIAETYNDQWIPLYNAAYILVTSSFKESGVASCDELLDRAVKHLDNAEELSPGESEIEVMKGMYFIGLMSADPSTRGPIYYEDAMNSIQKARELNPGNPRAIYLNGMMTLNMPDFMGGGPAAAKPIFLEAAEKFKTIENDDPLWPSWGEEITLEELSKMEDSPVE